VCYAIVLVLKFIPYVWKSGQQHRELIRNIQSGAEIFFGMLVERFRSITVRYFVCQNCSSRLTAMREEKCTVRAFPIHRYEGIKLPTL